MYKVALLFCLVGICCWGQICTNDPEGNRICASTQADGNVCGYFAFPGGGTQFFPPYHCNDILLEKTSPDGKSLYRRVLAGKSEDEPRQLWLDRQGNAILVGTTYSSDFPATTDAAQRDYAGPAPTPTSGYRIGAGGDLFLARISPQGEILYCTFIGSSADDNLFGAHAGPGSEVDLLLYHYADADTGPGIVPAASGTSLVTMDPASPRVVRSVALAQPGQARWVGDVIQSMTPTEFATFTREGVVQTRVALDDAHFSSIPAWAMDSRGDIWLAGPSSTEGTWPVLKLTGGATQAVRWALPIPASAYAGQIYVDSQDRVYFGGWLSIYADQTPLVTTPNAILTQPCGETYAGFVVVVDRDGKPLMVSYLPDTPRAFEPGPEGMVYARWVANDPAGIAVDLSRGPKLACAVDPLRSWGTQPFGVGQLITLRGNLFPVDSRVSIGDLPAPILSQSPTELTVTVPFHASEGANVPVVVSSEAGKATLPIAVRTVIPSILAIVNQDGTVNTPDHPASFGSVVSIYLTGAGKYSPELPDGQAAPMDTAHGLQEPVQVMFLFSGQASTPGTIEYAGPVPGLVAGVTQINVRLPGWRGDIHKTMFPQLSIGPVITQLQVLFVQ